MGNKLYRLIEEARHSYRLQYITSEGFRPYENPIRLLPREDSEENGGNYDDLEDESMHDTVINEVHENPIVPQVGGQINPPAVRIITVNNAHFCSA
jgi:hypothetical protein